MPKMPTPSDDPWPRADWQALQIVLDRCYVGPPIGRSGTFLGTVLTIVHLLKGEAIIEKDGVTVATHAGENHWIVCIPGKRTQQFSDDAEIISIHLSIPQLPNGAVWHGIPQVLARPDSAAWRALEHLRNLKAIRTLTPSQSLEIRGVALALPDALSIQEASSAFFRHLLRIIHREGMFFEIPEIRDLRVRNSYHALASLDLRQPFSRDTLAANHGLTAGQLDRLWKRELGTTPQQYRTDRRKMYACTQVRQLDTSIKSIASELGFRHLSQFSKWFRDCQGESPRQYRNRSRTES